MNHALVGQIIAAAREAAQLIIAVIGCIYFHKQVPGKFAAAVSLATEAAAKIDNPVLVSQIEHCADPGRMREEAVACFAMVCHSYGIPVDGGKLAGMALDELVKLHKAGRLAIPPVIENSIEAVGTTGDPTPAQKGGVTQ